MFIKFTIAATLLAALYSTSVAANNLPKKGSFDGLEDFSGALCTSETLLVRHMVENGSIDPEPRNSLVNAAHSQENKGFCRDFDFTKVRVIRTGKALLTPDGMGLLVLDLLSVVWAYDERSGWVKLPHPIELYGVKGKPGPVI